MVKKQKLLLKAMNNPSGLRFAEFVALVEAFGFVFDRQRGSHRIYVRSDFRAIVNIQPREDGKAKVAQVREFLDLIQRFALDLKEE